MAQALYDEHPIQEYLRVEVGEEEERLVPGTLPAFDRVLFIEELPPFDLRWLAPVFERVSETVREERAKRRKGEAFAEVFKWRLVSSILLATTPTGVAGTSVMTSRSALTASNDGDEDALSNKESAFSPNYLPGDLSALCDDESYYDAESSIPNAEEDAVELPSVPLLATSILVLLRFPQILLLVCALCLPFCASFLAEERLWRLLLQLDENDHGESAAAELDYEETLSTLDSLINCCEVWEQTTHLATTYLSSLQFTSYAYSPGPADSDFPQMMDTAVPVVLSEILAQTLRTTSSHTSTIRSLLNALARSPREMRMLERMYAPLPPAHASPTKWRSPGNSGLKRSRSTTSVSSSPALEEEDEEKCSVDEEDVKSRLSPSPSIQRRGILPLSLSPSSPSLSLGQPTIHSAPSSTFHSPTPSLLSPSPSRARSPILSPPHTRHQSLVRSSEATSGHLFHRIPYSTSNSISDLRSHLRPQLPALSTPASQSSLRSTGVSSTASTPGQRSLPTSPQTKFTTLPSRVGSPSNGTHPIRSRRRSLSSLRPWSASASEVVTHSSLSPLPNRPSSSPSSGTITLDSTPTPRNYQSPPIIRPVTHDLEPIMIPTSELMDLKKDAKGEIRFTAGCFLGLRFLSPSDGPSGRRKNQYTVTDLWNHLGEYIWPSSHEPFLAPPEPKKKPSDESFLIHEDEEEEEDDALDTEIGYDPAYWEDVRSVLGLFKTALEDGTEKIKEAFPDSVFPSTVPPESVPSSTLVTTPASALPLPNALVDMVDVTDEIGKTNELLSFLKGGNAAGGSEIGFAPMASHLARFVRHMEAMQEALTDAQVALRESIQFLSSASTSSAPLSPTTLQEQETGYDRLRSALGVALRECERGRGPLIDHLHPNTSRFGLDHRVNQSIPEELEDSDHLRESMPLLIHDDQDDHERSSTESMPMSSPPTAMRETESLATIIEGHPPEVHQPTLQQLLEHAILNIPEGHEQIYEAETETQPSFDRKRSTLSREERIKQAKERRANGERMSATGKEKSRRSFRPGLDAIQELKDVIWQVGERRKRMSRGSPTSKS